MNDRHYKRICDLLDSAPNKKVIIGGDRNADARYIGPTVVTGVSPDDKLMQEEIFGPVLPVMTVTDHHEAIEFINSRLDVNSLSDTVLYMQRNTICP